MSLNDVIAADKATVELAWPGPWIVDLVGDPGNRTWHVTDGTCDRAFICSLPDRREADLIAAARSRWPVYIAAIEAVEAICAELADNIGGWDAEIAARFRRALVVLAPSTEETK